jgi:DNA-binding GntR family transcriptional regulator
LTESSFRSLHDDIYASLRKALMSGDLVPGQAVSIRALATQFGTSVIPVRDALRRLVAERGLNMLPNRTVAVSRMTRRRYQEILNVRLSLEPVLAEKATDLISPKEIVNLESINERMQSAVGKDNVKLYLLANQEFHFALYNAAQSTVMMPIVESLWMQVGPFMHAVFTASGTRNARDSHAGVLKALRRKDSRAVAVAIERDLGDAADVVLSRTDFPND